MRALAAITAALALALPAAAQAQTPYPGDCEDQGPSKVTTPGTFKALPQEVVDIPSKVDGRPLQIGFIRPDGPPGYRAPVIVHAGPYHSRDLKDADLTQCARFLTANYVQHGYAVALVPTRGTADTDGCANLFGKIERSDLDDALTWLGTRPWSNGRIGMVGISYSGSTPWVAAATGNPYLKTIVPEDGVNDLFDLSLSVGTLDSRFWFFVPGYYHYYGPVQNNPAWSGRDPERTVNAATTCPDVQQGIAAALESGDTGARDKGGLLRRAQRAPARRAQLPRQRAVRRGADRLERAPGAHHPVDRLLARARPARPPAARSVEPPVPRRRGRPYPLGLGRPAAGLVRPRAQGRRARVARPGGRGRGLVREVAP